MAAVFTAILLAVSCNVRGEETPASLTPGVETVVSGNNQFAVDIFAQLAQENGSGENLLVSPFSISTALAMAYAGARGQTATQMADVLHFDLPDEQLHPAFGALLSDLTGESEAYTLQVANRLFGQGGLSLNTEMSEITSRHYRAPLEPLDFAGSPEPSRLHINRWVESQTNDRIKDLLPEGSINRDTRLVLTNAVYVDADWEHKFQARATHDALFRTSLMETMTVSMMRQLDEFRYGDFDSFQMLELPYVGGEMSMLLLLPHEIDGLESLETSLTSELLTESHAQLAMARVSVALPKFRFESSFALADALSALGMTDALTAAADFSGIADEPLAISSIVHKTFVEVNEAGTEAAAATGVVFSTTGMPLDPVEIFRADHPFLFALRHNPSGSLLFMGRTVRPEPPDVPNIPEPSAALLFTSGVIALVVARRGRPRLHGC